jgi:hypothetical protein
MQQTKKKKKPVSVSLTVSLNLFHDDWRLRWALKSN